MRSMADRVARLLRGFAVTTLIVAPVILVPMLVFVSPSPSAAKTKSKIPAVRWDEQIPGCTFSRSNDGLYHYGMWSGDVGIVVSIDSQELEKVHRRHEPFFSALLEVRYRGTGALDFDPGNITLEFVKHYHVIQTSLDPDNFSQKIQDDADALDHETAREIEKHPEKKDVKEAFARTFQKESAELQEFVSKDSLRPAKLNAGNPVRGWILFGVSSKWIGGWKKPEELILRVPADGKMFEFPFTLPPKPGEVILRKRD
jgi:hypothetical protein